MYDSSWSESYINSEKCRVLAQPRRANHSIACPAPSAKIFRFTFDPTHLFILVIPAHTKGRFAIVTNVGRGMQWTRAALLTRALVLRTAKPCGPDAPTLASSSREAKLLGGDGGKKARSPRRVRRKPLKPLRAGMPGDSGATVVTMLACLLFLHAGLRVHWAPGIPHALFGRKVFCRTRAPCVAGRRGCVSMPSCHRPA